MEHSVYDLIPSGGDRVLALCSTDNFTMTNSWLAVLLDSDGNVMWEVSDSGEGHALCKAGLALDDGTFLLAGWTGAKGSGYGLQAESQDVMTVRLDGSGRIIETEVIGNQGSQDPRFILETTDGFLVIGVDAGEQDGSTDVFSLSVDGT